MTKEEAIKEMIRAYDVLDFSSHMDNRRKEAFNMAKEALEQQPCEDAISRQADIMAMNELHVTDRDVYGMELSKCFDNDKANGKLLSLPPVQPTSGWIPVSERLPENIRPVIVTWKNNNPESYYQHIVGKHFIGVAHYLKGKWYWYSSTTEDFLAEYGRYEGEEFDEAIEVIAWQPLPEPYKAEK